MLLNTTDPLFQTLDAFLNLAVRELNERSGFLKLFIQIRSIIGMTPVEMHLEPFGHELEFMPEPFGQHTGVSLGIGNFSAKGPGQICPKGFSSGADNLLNLCKRFLIHTPPFEQANIMASAAVSQTGLPPLDSPACFGLVDFKVLLLEKPGGALKSQFTETKGYRWHSQKLGILRVADRFPVLANRAREDLSDSRITQLKK